MQGLPVFSGLGRLLALQAPFREASREFTAGRGVAFCVWIQRQRGDAKVGELVGALRTSTILCTLPRHAVQFPDRRFA